MARSSRKMVFTEEPVDTLDDLMAAAAQQQPDNGFGPQAATPDPTPYVQPGRNPPPGHPDHHNPRNPPPERDNPRPRPGESIPYPPPDPNIGEGDDSDVANPDVPGSSPRPRHPKPEEQGDPTPDPKPDEPSEEKDDGPKPAAALDAAREETYRRQRPNLSASPAQGGLVGEIMPRSARYEARITILDAFHYPGSLRDAPEWVDRNWVGYGDDDALRGIVAGPCLRVPKHNIHEDVVLARVGDYVTRQEVRLAPGIPGDIRVEVWAKEQFEKMFLPVAV